ncbi:hypothetical protein OF83DRAFT_1175239 [Amylostereum chailletii]|nr:hypothetical protein OF83DRAFT_1175239 [Amylostereum chailletii]
MLSLGRPFRSSPSVSIEKGGYRIHNRPTRLWIDTDAKARAHSPSKLRSTSTASISAKAAIRYERRMVSLLVALLLASVACFGTAWWLIVHGERAPRR